MRDPHQHKSNNFMLTIGMLVGIAFGQVAIADPEESAAVQSAPEAGKQVYNEICVACHVPPGIGGAPALGDDDAWAPRIAQGIDTLIDHALNGYSGSTGIMPRKGGRTDLSDAEIIAAIEYMLKQVAR